MIAMRTNVLHAVRLASRSQGCTAQDLAAAAGMSLRSAQELLKALCGDGVLSVAVPPRKGQRRGQWRNLYRVRGGGLDGL